MHLRFWSKSRRKRRLDPVELRIPPVLDLRVGSPFRRLEDAIKILEYVLKLREEKLGTAHPDVEDEKKRLAELLKEAGRGRSRTAKSLENLLDANSRRVKKEGTRRWSGLGFRI